MDAAEKKGVVAFKWEDAPKRNRFNDTPYQWVTSQITGPRGMIKDPRQFGVTIQSVMPERGVPPDTKLQKHPFDTLFLVLKGRLVCCAEGVDYELGAGSCIYFPRDTFHGLIKVIDQAHVLSIVSDPLAHPTTTSPVPWYEQYPEPRPRKVISTRTTCLYDGTSHHTPYTSDKERAVITDAPPTGMDAAEKKGVVAFKWEDAPKRNRFNDARYQWVTSSFTGERGMIKDPQLTTEFRVMIQSVMPGRGVPHDMKLHRHPTFDTLFLVLKGRLVWCSEGVDYELGAGSFIYFPRDAFHEFIEVIDHAHVLAICGDPLASHGANSSPVPWYEQYPEPRPRKVISTRTTCLYDGTSH